MNSKNISGEVRFVLGLNKYALFTRFIAGFLRACKSYMHALFQSIKYDWFI